MNYTVIFDLHTIGRISQHFRGVSKAFHYLYPVDPKSIPMRIIYTTLFMVFSLMLSAQEPSDFQNQKTEDNATFKLYPNPVYDDLVYMIGQEKGPKDIVVFDVFGEVVLTERIYGNALNVSRLVPGVYVVRVAQQKKTVTRKLVVK